MVGYQATLNVSLSCSAHSFNKTVKTVTPYCPSGMTKRFFGSKHLQFLFLIIKQEPATLVAISCNYWKNIILRVLGRSLYLSTLSIFLINNVVVTIVTIRF